MDENKQREIASKGGKASHEKGTAHEFTSEEAREAGKASHEKGTAHEFTSEEAREAGRKGGESSHGGHGQGSSHEKDSSSSTRGGTHEQHVKAGRLRVLYQTSPGKEVIPQYSHPATGWNISP
jgi:uncharacterized protein